MYLLKSAAGIDNLSKTKLLCELEIRSALLITKMVFLSKVSLTKCGFKEERGTYFD